MAGLTGKIPKLTGASGKCFRRSHFLDGTLNTYFGPGQNPDVVTLPGSLEGGSNPLFASEYYPPTDWRPAGSILTPPQVVWLSLAQLDPLTPVYKPQATETAILLQWVPDPSSAIFPLSYVFTDNSVASIPSQQAIDDAIRDGVVPKEWNGPFYIIKPIPTTESGIPLLDDFARLASDDSGFVGVMPEISNILTFSSVPNPCAADYPVIKDAFMAAASAINELRPGKTWVQVYDWTSASQAYQDFIDRGFTGDKGVVGSMVLPWRSDLLIPPAAAAPFFGTNFLHIHSGAWTSTGGAFSEFNFDVGGVGYSTFLTDMAPANFAASFPQFAGYAAMLYSPAPITYPAATWINVGTVAKPSDTAHVADTPGLSFADRLATTNSDGQGQAAFFTANNMGWRDNIANNQMAIAETLKDFGVTYEGLETQLSSVDVIIGIIADHFGFDPDTGKDLPLGG